MAQLPKIDPTKLGNFQILSLKEAILKSQASGLAPIIAEIKFASPSFGQIRQKSNLQDIANAMIEGGACALSILTEPNFFNGSIEYLKKISTNKSVPLLRKDFIIDEQQIYESLINGADAILLIVRCLSDEKLNEFYKISKKFGLEALVEVHNENELERALNIEPEIIGINNRNLDTFQLDLSIIEKLIPKIPEDIIVVAESGVQTPQDVKYLLRCGADAVLVGTAIMKAEDISAKTKELVHSSI